MEENFEKKSSKRVAITLCVTAIVLALIIVAGIFYFALSGKPEKIFKKAIEDSFEMKEEEELKTARVEVEFSLEMEANDAETRAANEILKAIKLKAATEMDLDNEILNQNISASYDGEQVISLDALIQNETMYIYLNEIFDKYIQIDEEYLEGVNLSTIFEAETEVVSEALVEDIKELLINEINSQELSKEKVEINGENVQKSTLRLTPKEILEILVKVLELVNEHQPTAELQDSIETLKDEVKYMDNTDNYAEISIYTKGIKNKVVKADIVIVNEEYDEVIAIELNKNSEAETEISFLMNEESKNLKKAQELITIIINEESENKGTAKLKMNIEEGSSIILNIKYNTEYNVKIKERNTSNSVMIDNITEADLNEMYENIQDNEILSGIVEMVINTVNGSGLIEEVNDDLSKADQGLIDYSDYNYEYNYDYDYSYDLQNIM